jgi:predicted nucleic acid-binding protein
MKVYLDNNVLSAIARDDTPTETDALDRLLAAYDEGKVDLVTSDLSLGEIKQYAGSGRKLTERTFRLLKKVPMVPWDELLGVRTHGGRYTWISGPIIRSDELYASFLTLGLEVVDARHLFVAAKQGCDVFLTCDRGVLARAKDIRRLCELTVQKPSDLVTGETFSPPAAS